METQSQLFNLLMVSLDLEVMSMKGYISLLISPELKIHNQIRFVAESRKPIFL